MSRIVRFGLLALLCAMPLGLAATADAAPHRFIRGRACYARSAAIGWCYHHGHWHGHHCYHR